jgi:quinol monooxygenase YgiN
MRDTPVDERRGRVHDGNVEREGGTRGRVRASLAGERRRHLAPDPGVAFKLYRSREHPRRYVSMGEGWRHAEQVEAVRESPEFQDSLASIWRVLESGELGTLDLVVEIS